MSHLPPSVLKEKTKEWFDIEIESPYMLFVADITKNKKINVNGDLKEILDKVKQETEAILEDDRIAGLK